VPVTNQVPERVTKQQWRSGLLAARRAVPAAVRAVEAVALAAHARELGVAWTVACAYVPVGAEPGSLELLEMLRASGARVLLPVAREPAALHWAEFAGAAELADAPHGLREPSGPVLDPATVAQAELVLLPALAVDRAGVRLGRGAGFYDRTLLLAAPGARLMAVVRDDEVVAALPTDPHDVAVGWALTPIRGLVRLGGR